MGDAVYEVYIRRAMLEKGTRNPKRLHRQSVVYVRAGAQARAIEGIFEKLSEEEQKLVKRARNHNPATKAKNADIMTYKWATAFEALIGWLYLRGSTERMEEMIFRAMEIIEEA